MVRDPPSISRRVVEEIAAEKGVDERDIEPLYSTIDPEALDLLVDPPHRDPPKVTVGFNHAGKHVFIDQAGEIYLMDTEDDW